MIYRRGSGRIDLRGAAAHIRAMPAPKAKPAAANPAAPATSRPLKTGDHVFLVDGSGYIFRAYHALPPLTRKSDGLQINAVLGFCNMLWKLLREMKPEDSRRISRWSSTSRRRPSAPSSTPTTRRTGRTPPDDLIPQFPLIREAVRAFDIPCLEQAGFEADDLIATYARLPARPRPPPPSCPPTRT